MALTTAQLKQVQDMLAQTQQMQKQLAQVQKATETFREAEQLGIQYTPETRSSDLARQIEQVKAQPTLKPTSTSTPTPTDVAKDVQLPRKNITLGGVTFNLPVDLINKSSFQSASEEHKVMIAQMWQSVADQGYDIQTVLSAFEVAAQQSNVYMRQQIRTFENEAALSLGYIIEDYGVGKELTLRRMTESAEDLEAYERMMARRKSELEEDLEYHSGELDLDETRTLQTQLKNYELQLDQTRDTMASRGLFHSSIRGRAEDLLSEAHKDITEDIETKFARQRRELQIGVERQLADMEFQAEQQRIQAQRQQQSYQDQLAQLQIQAKRGATDILRKSEQYLGTEQTKTLLPNLGIQLQQQDWMPADWMVGDIRATGLKAQQQQDILQRASAFLGQ